MLQRCWLHLPAALLLASSQTLASSPSSSNSLLRFEPSGRSELQPAAALQQVTEQNETLVLEQELNAASPGAGQTNLGPFSEGPGAAAPVHELKQVRQSGMRSMVVRTDGAFSSLEQHEQLEQHEHERHEFDPFGANGKTPGPSQDNHVASIIMYVKITLFAVCIVLIGCVAWGRLCGWRPRPTDASRSLGSASSAENHEEQHRAMEEPLLRRSLRTKSRHKIESEEARCTAWTLAEPRVEAKDQKQQTLETCKRAKRTRGGVYIRHLWESERHHC